MENAADALKIAFGVLVFTVALAITFSVIAQAKKTSDVVLFHSDKNNFRDLMDDEDIQQEKKAYISDVVYTLNRIAEGETITVSIIINGTEVVPKNLGTSEKAIGTFISELMSGHITVKTSTGLNTIEFDLNKPFNEKFVEVYYTGMYKRADDGTEITISQGGTREYITFTYPYNDTI